MLNRRWQSLELERLELFQLVDAEPQLLKLAATAIEDTGFSCIALQLAMAWQGGKARLFTVTDISDCQLAVSLEPHMWPGFMLQTSSTSLSPSGLPTIASSNPGAAVASLVNNLKQIVLFKSVPQDGAAYHHLRDEAARFAVLDCWQRAGLHCTGSYDAWFEANFDAKRRKEFKRQHSRLSEMGKLEIQVLNDKANLSGFLADFLELEEKSWKGTRGTAITQDAVSLAALQEALPKLFAQGKLLFWRMMLDGKPIAALFATVNQSRATLGKIAHAEDYAKYSPGVMLVLQATKHFFDDDKITLADSNAIPDHPMINRIWRDRLPMADIAVASARVGTTRFQVSVNAEKTRRKLRAIAKSAYYRLKGLRAS
jgi:CelD/BcsL family acetyltransferase involved in cellulose biosynthesis